MENGSELISQKMAQWAEADGVELDFIQAGKPSQKAYAERFNRTFGEDVFDTYLFTCRQEDRDITEEWIEEYNTIRPQEAWDNMLLKPGMKNGGLTRTVQGLSAP